MGITNLSSGRGRQVSLSQDTKLGNHSLPSSRESSPVKGSTGIRVVQNIYQNIKDVRKFGQPEQRTCQNVDKSILQRDVFQTGCKQFIFGTDRPDETRDGYIGSVCIFLLGLTFLLILKSGKNSKLIENITSEKNAAAQLPAQGDDDRFDSESIFSVAAGFMLLGLIGALLSRFCVNNTPEEDECNERVDLEAGNWKKFSQPLVQPSVVYEASQALNKSPDFVYSLCEKAAIQDSVQEKNRCSTIRVMPAIDEEVHVTTELYPSADDVGHSKASLDRPLKDLSTSQEKESVNDDIKPDMLLTGCRDQAASFNVKIDSVNANTPLAGMIVDLSRFTAQTHLDKNETGETGSLMGRVVVESFSSASIPEMFEVATNDSSDKEDVLLAPPFLPLPISIRDQGSGQMDVSSVRLHEDSEIVEFHEFVQETEFALLTPDQSQKFKRYLSKMSMVDFQKFEKAVKNRDSHAVEELINNWVARKFRHDGDEKRHEIVQLLLAEVSGLPCTVGINH